MSRLIDLTGQRFGRLTVVSRAENTKNGDARWNCVCDCGKQTNVKGSRLRSGGSQSCGCLREERASKANKRYNTFRVDGEKVFVKLSNVDKEMIVDADIWSAWAHKICWHLSKDGYAMAYSPELKKNIRFHLFAFPLPEPGLVRDHIDGNRLNNTRANIRFVTQQKNNLNHKVGKLNKSGYTGVYWRRDKKKWKAEITIGGKHIHLGYFQNLRDAIAAREAAEIKYFGEYRRKD
ncbi:MAG: hypothetical protein HDT15_01540 [Oscillibacter sp.]|nr:hypothetical protein [Oscillibacter sp.]